MKVYLTEGTYFEKQADAHKAARAAGTTFKTIDLPFGATPKADLIDWLNQLDYGPGVSTRIAEPNSDNRTGVAVSSVSLSQTAQKTLYDIDGPLLVDQRVAEQAARPKPTPHQPRPVPHADAVIEFVLDTATPAEVENIFGALGTRFHEMRKEVSDLK